jgi:hypothetical protein
MSKMILPWEYSKPGTPEKGVLNLPSPEGAELGREMARLADGAEREMLAAYPDQKPRCGTCAFRAGTVPNACAVTLMDAVKCGVEGEPFYCHKGVIDPAAAKVLCSGWLAWQVNVVQAVKKAGEK